jgi:hypothetical protein
MEITCPGAISEKLFQAYLSRHKNHSVLDNPNPKEKKKDI